MLQSAELCFVLLQGKCIVSQNPISSEIEKAMDLIDKSLKSNTPSSVRWHDNNVLAIQLCSILG